MDRPFDLDAYLKRIALAAPPPPDAAGLALLQRAHRLAIPYESLDVALGRPIAIDRDAVFAKLVQSRRGGWCFEHNRLLLDALEALGFEARPLLARVWLGSPPGVPPRTHAVALVTIDGRLWIADAGFGGGYSPPLPLEDGASAIAPDGATFTFSRDPQHGWMLRRHGDAEGADGRPATGTEQYSFTTEPVFPADLAMSNHWVQTARESRFVQHRIVSIVLPQGLATLVDTHYRRRNGSQRSEGEIVDPRVFRLRLAMMFGIELSAEEIGRLGLFEAAQAA